MMNAKEPASLTPAAAADFLGVSARSMERWRVQRTGPEYCKLPPGRFDIALRPCGAGAMRQQWSVASSTKSDRLA
jgi:hypothetical protein